LSGSTNAVIHLAAIAGRIGLRLDPALLRAWGTGTPVLTDVRPAGPHLLSDLEEDGGIPAVVGELARLVHLDCVTVTGRLWVDEPPERRAAVRVVRQLDDPIERVGALAVLTGTLAPDGAIIKRSTASARLLNHTRPAVVFDGVDDLHARIDDPSLPVDAQRPRSAVRRAPGRPRNARSRTPATQMWQRPIVTGRCHI